MPGELDEDASVHQFSILSENCSWRPLLREYISWLIYFAILFLGMDN